MSLGPETHQIVGSQTDTVKSVVLVDDNPVVAVGLGFALQNSRNLRLVATAIDPAGCIAMLHSHRPDALVIDLVFGGLIRMDLIMQCRTAHPEVAIVVFSSLPETLYERQTMAAGADSYLCKSADLSVLLQLVASTMARAPRPSRNLASVGHEAPALVPGSVHLTQREIEIARYVGRGLSMALIARELGISANTVAVHRDNIRKKLNCRDTKDLVARLAWMDGANDAFR